MGSASGGRVPGHLGRGDSRDTVLVGVELLVRGGISAPFLARLTTNALEIKTGVFFRKESTIPLNRVTDLRLHDGPVMRHYGLRGLKVETAGSSGQNSGSEGNLIGVIDAEDFRNAVLAQRQKVVDAESGRAATPAPAAGEASGSAVLVEIRDILARMEAHMGQGGNA